MLRPSVLSSAAVISFGVLLSGGCEQQSAPSATINRSTASPEPTATTESVAGTAAAAETTAPAVTPDTPQTEPADTLEPGTAATDPQPPADATALAGPKVKLGSPELTAGILGTGPLKLEEIELWLNDSKNHEVLNVELPLGLDAGRDQIKGLDKNPLTRAKIELGRQLYFDGRLSANDKVSCAHCHHPEDGFGRHTQFGVGIDEQQGGRNSPISYNRILSDVQFWDGRAATLEEQAKGPIANPIEMGYTHDECVEKLKGIEGYRVQFERIFGELTIDRVAEAIASFERAIVTLPSPFDYYERFKPLSGLDPDDLKTDDPELFAVYESAKADAERQPMSESAIRGREIFFGNKGSCTACHVGPNLTDEKYHNLGVGMDKDQPDLGREVVTKDEKDRGAFKTPTIRNVALTAPYMHDGGTKTLEEVVEWYDKGGHANPHLSDKIKKLNLTAEDKADLVAFMQACTGEFPVIETGRLPE